MLIDVWGEFKIFFSDFLFFVGISLSDEWCIRNLSAGYLVNSLKYDEDEAVLLSGCPCSFVRSDTLAMCSDPFSWAVTLLLNSGGWMFCLSQTFVCLCSFRVYWLLIGLTALHISKAITNNINVIIIMKIITMTKYIGIILAMGVHTHVYDCSPFLLTRHVITK